MTSEFDVVMVDKMFPVLEDLGVEANLLGEMELRDTGDNFQKRLEMSMPSVLSNVYPLDPESKYADLKQFYKKQLQGGVNVYFLNLFEESMINDSQNIKANYEPINPIEFIDKFVKQINPRDLLVASVNFRKVETLNEFMESASAKKIDLLFIPTSIGGEFLTDDEQVLISSRGGWDPNKPQPAPKPFPPELNNQPQSQTIPPQPESESNVNNGDSADTNATAEGENKDTENKESSNQGGTKVDEGTGENEEGQGENPGKDNQDPERDKQSNLQKVFPTPTESENQPPVIAPGTSVSSSARIDTIDLTFENRKFIEIQNKYRAVPIPDSAEYMREIHFIQKPNGEVEIEVTDVIIDSRYPENPEIKKISDDVTEKVDNMRLKEAALRRAGNIRMQVINSPESPYIGSAECQKCHASIYDSWKTSPHATALQTLKNKSAQSNDQCLKCHVTQYTQPEWYNRTWSFEGHTEEVGCESCHGPGKGHVLLINTITDAKTVQFWDDLYKNEPTLNLSDVSTDAKSRCMLCHDQAWSPKFDFVAYWEKIKHSETEEEKVALRNRLTSEKGGIVESRLSPLAPASQNGQKPPVAPTT